MRGYVETMERLAFNMPEGRNPTDDEIRSAMPRNPRPLPIAAYCKPMGRNMRPDTEELPMRDDIARCAELAALDDVVNANIRQMAGPNQLSKDEE